MIGRDAFREDIDLAFEPVLLGHAVTVIDRIAVMHAGITEIQSDRGAVAVDQGALFPEVGQIDMGELVGVAAGGADEFLRVVGQLGEGRQIHGDAFTRRSAFLNVSRRDQDQPPHGGAKGDRARDGTGFLEVGQLPGGFNRG